MRAMVDLPDPLSPARPYTCPRSIDEGDVVDGLDLAGGPPERVLHREGLAEIDDLQHRPAHDAASAWPKRVPPVRRGTAAISARV